MMTGIAPINPMMPGLGIVPPPISQDLPIVKEIIHCKSCTLFPPNPSEFLSIATSFHMLFRDLHLTVQLAFMHHYTLFSILMHFKACCWLWRCRLESGMPDQTNRWSLRVRSKLLCHCSETLRGCIDLTLGFWQVIYLSLEEYANRSDCCESHLPLTWVDWLITDSVMVAHKGENHPFLSASFLPLLHALVLSRTPVICMMDINEKNLKGLKQIWGMFRWSSGRN